MNVYFILEGEKTEMLVYPAWIQHALPNYKRVLFAKDATKDCYYLFSGGGIPSIYSHTANAIKDINANPIYDKLVICLDGEEIGATRRTNKLISYLEESGVQLNQSCELIVIIQNACIETWFLGNRKIVKKTPENVLLRKYLSHFDVSHDDPEQMPTLDQFRNKAHFHYHYLKEIFKEHKLIYSKANPGVVANKSYLGELTKRISETGHLPSLKDFLEFLSGLSKVEKQNGI